MSFTITQVYFGKDGCACGCRGTHYTAANQRMVTRAVNVIRRAAPSTVLTGATNGLINDGWVEVPTGKNRVVRVYFVGASS